ncbi:MAG: hypothetical protein KAU89_08400 [Candidatus Thorarchaeota archaeon]|nr:hypothetical protein [Candidatus Thorarchaeota archaeon]
MPSVVEKYNPNKASALSRKRDLQRGAKRGRSVAIRELTLHEVREDAVQFGLATELHYQLKAGKEASIFLASWKSHPIILKAYRFWHSTHTSKKKGFFAPGAMEALAAKEYDVLLACFKTGVPCPTPIGRVGNYVTMRFIGDGHEAAPQLKDAQLENPEAVLDQILDDYLIMYRDAHYIHGDLSRYNILWWKKRPWIIDVPQACKVTPWSDMKQVSSLLRRDIKNVLSYFERYDMHRNLDQIVEVFLSSYTPDNQKNFRERVSVLPRSEW